MGLVFKVTDNRGKVRKVKDQKPIRDEEEEKRFTETDAAKEEKEDAQFTKDEIKALKSLIENLDDLLALVKPADKKDKKEKDGKKDDKDDKSLEEEFEFEEEEVKDSDEKILDLPDGEKEEASTTEVTEDGLVEVDDELDEVNENKHVGDSKKSFGAIETKDSVNDLNNDIQAEINAAWAKRLGGRK